MCSFGKGVFKGDAMQLSDKKFHHMFVDGDLFGINYPVTVAEGISLARSVLGEKIPPDRNALIDFVGDTLFMRTQNERVKNITYPR